MSRILFEYVSHENHHSETVLDRFTIYKFATLFQPFSRDLKSSVKFGSLIFLFIFDMRNSLSIPTGTTRTTLLFSRRYFAKVIEDFVYIQLGIGAKNSEIISRPLVHDSSDQRQLTVGVFSSHLG